MVDRSFERTIPFYQVPTPQGPVWLPIVIATLLHPTGSRVDLPLIFDTGASVTTLRRDLYYLLGLNDWNVGAPVQTAAAGGIIEVYQYEANLEFLGKAVSCPVHLAPLSPNPLYVGLLGRHTMFEQFGFGFWESTHELYVTLAP